MIAWWNSLDLFRQLMYTIAIPSTIILVLQTVLLLFGMGQGGDGDASDGGLTDMDGFPDGADADTDTDMLGGIFGQDNDGGIQGPEHTAGLRMLSVRGFVAFLSVTGWIGVAMMDLGINRLVASVIGVLCGLGAMMLVAVALRASMKLQQSGNMDLNNAVGLIGEVYVSVPFGGKGKVTVVIQERFTELDAICKERALKIGEQVKINQVTENNVLVVSPL